MMMRLRRMGKNEYPISDDNPAVPFENGI